MNPWTRGSKTEEGDYIPKDFADWREIPSEALGQRELREALTKALESLPEKYRTVLILRDVQHLSINETAKVLGLTEANVKTRLSRARLQMRDALAPGFDGAWSRGRAYQKGSTFLTSVRALNKSSRPLHVSLKPLELPFPLDLA